MDVTETLKALVNYGAVGLGWPAFFWAMKELRKSRSDRDALVFQLVQIVAKQELLESQSDENH